VASSAARAAEPDSTKSAMIDVPAQTPREQVTSTRNIRGFNMILRLLPTAGSAIVQQGARDAVPMLYYRSLPASPSFVGPDSFLLFF
jgi:hypothetical protein